MSNHNRTETLLLGKGEEFLNCLNFTDTSPYPYIKHTKVKRFALGDQQQSFGLRARSTNTFFSNLRRQLPPCSYSNNHKNIEFMNH